MNKACDLSDIQSKALNHIKWHLVNNQRIPTITEVSEFFFWKSANAASSIVTILKRKGYLNDRKNKTPSYTVANIKLTFEEIDNA